MAARKKAAKRKPAAKSPAPLKTAPKTTKVAKSPKTTTAAKKAAPGCKASAKKASSKDVERPAVPPEFTPDEAQEIMQRLQDMARDTQAIQDGASRRALELIEWEQFGLSEKHQRFVEAYVMDPNATKAAIAAGYTDQWARSQGSRLTTHVDIARAIAECKRLRSWRVQCDTDYVMESTRELLERCLQKRPVYDAFGKPVPGLWTFDSKGAAAALKFMHEHHGTAAPKKTELTGAGGGPILTKDLSKMSDAELEARIAELEQKRA